MQTPYSHILLGGGLVGGYLRIFYKAFFYYKRYYGILFAKYTITLYTSGYNSVEKLTPIARIFFYNTP